MSMQRGFPISIHPSIHKILWVISLLLVDFMPLLVSLIREGMRQHTSRLTQPTSPLFIILKAGTTPNLSASKRPWAWIVWQKPLKASTVSMKRHLPLTLQVHVLRFRYLINLPHKSWWSSTPMYWKNVSVHLHARSGGRSFLVNFTLYINFVVPVSPSAWWGYWWSAKFYPTQPVVWCMVNSFQKHSHWLQHACGC